MENVFSELKKALENAIHGIAPTQEISVAEFPAYVLKQLQSHLQEEDAEKSLSKLERLVATVDEVAAKVSAGAAEDMDSIKITVPVFQESGLTTQRTETELSPAAAGQALGDSAVHFSASDLAALVGDVRALKDGLAALSGQRAEGADEAASKADKEDEEDDDKSGGDNDKRRRKDADGASEESSGDDSDTVEKAGADWPMDMNTTMPGATGIAKADDETRWGDDPDWRSEAV